MSLVSLREAGRRLKRNPKEIKGACVARGIELSKVGNTLAITEGNLEILRLIFAPQDEADNNRSVDID